MTFGTAPRVFLKRVCGIRMSIMKKNFSSFLYALCTLLPFALVACNNQPAIPNALLATVPALATLAPTEARITYTDPFAYCAAVGTIDAPDSRYTGDPIPLMIIQGYLKAAGLENNGCLLYT